MNPKDDHSNLYTIGAVAALVGAAVYYEHGKFRAPLPGEPRTPPQTPPIMNVPGHPRTTPTSPLSIPIPVRIGTTPDGNPTVTIAPVNPITQQPVVLPNLSTQGVALPQAHALYDFLVANGTSPTATLIALVIDFQNAHDSDANAVKAAGRLAQNGTYDLPTSAALTVYTGSPVPPDFALVTKDAVQMLSQAVQGAVPGPAASSASNLYAYLKTHARRSTSPTANANADSGLKSATLTFQRAVNTDPLFPGPASPNKSSAVIKSKLDEDGIFGAKTSDALAVSTFERINPNQTYTPPSA